MVKCLLASLAALAFGLLAGWSIVALSPASMPAAAPLPATMPKGSMPAPAPSADEAAPRLLPPPPAAAPPPPRPAVTRTVESTFVPPPKAAAAPAAKKNAWKSERAWRAASRRYLRDEDDNDD
jgi:hypothetical protein